MASRGMCGYLCFIPLGLMTTYPVPGRDRRDLALGAAPIFVGAVKTGVDGFGSLKTVLGDIYTDHKVRL